MAFDEDLADRVRRAVGRRSAFDEKRMFGGLCILVGGHMVCGVMGDQLMVRVGKDGHADAIAQPHAKEMDFTGRAMTGMVWVDPEGVEMNEDLDGWVARGLAMATSLPPKPPKPPKAPKAKKGSS